MNKINKWINRFFGSAAFIGYLPFAPGTFGSLAGAALTYWLIAHAKVSISIYILACAAVGVIAFFFAEKAAKSFNQADPPEFVLDEAFGQMLTFIGISYSWMALAMGFLFFRFFDIIKTYPIGESERIEGGAGIVMDDLIAGLCACASLHLTILTYHRLMSYLAS
jgi:phosphatidylglycerophosphatase A